MNQQHKWCINTIRVHWHGLMNDLLLSPVGLLPLQTYSLYYCTMPRAYSIPIASSYLKPDCGYTVYNEKYFSDDHFSYIVRVIIMRAWIRAS